MGGVGGGGGRQRAGLVGDQMSSQWGRNDEVRMEGRREGGRYIGRGGGFTACCIHNVHNVEHADKSHNR